MEDFNYVINPPEIPHVIFGSGLVRDPVPLTGPSVSSFMRVNQPETRSYPGPTDNATVHRVKCLQSLSVQGHAAFASKSLRLPRTASTGAPGVGSYTIQPQRVFKQVYKPFNISAVASPHKPFLTPGSASYDYHLRRPQERVCMSFGYMRHTWPQVAVFCSPTNNCKCHKCGKTPYGDYWHNFGNNLDMCRPCMKKELNLLKRCSTSNTERYRMLSELKRYAQARYCGFFHNHNGTTAAMQVMSSATLRFKINKENYLNLYMSAKE